MKHETLKASPLGNRGCFAPPAAHPSRTKLPSHLRGGVGVGYCNVGNVAVVRYYHANAPIIACFSMPIRSIPDRLAVVIICVIREISVREKISN